MIILNGAASNECENDGKPEKSGVSSHLLTEEIGLRRVSTTTGKGTMAMMKEEGGDVAWCAAGCRGPDQW